MALTPKITPFLWFPNPLAQEAADFYVTLFNNSPNPHREPSTIIRKTTYPQSTISDLESRDPPEPAHPPTGSVLTVDFRLCGQSFIALNGPHMPDRPQNSLFPFNESVSFSIECEDQAEVDYFWDRLTGDGGKESECGWCKDKYSVSWQVVPRQLRELMSGGGGAGEAVGGAMMKMKKFDIQGLEDAAKAAREGK